MKFSILTIYLATAFVLRAGEVRLTPVSASEYARRHNPALAAARFRIEEARGRLTQSGRLSNPELEFEFRHTPDFREGAFGISFMQKFPITNRLRLEKAISRAELAAAEAEVRDAERKLRATVEVAAIKIVALEQQRILRDKQLVNSREAAQATVKRAAVGEASTVDAAQFELEARQLETERLQLNVERATLVGELRPLLGLRVNDTLSMTGDLAVPDRLPSSRPNVADRPDVVAAHHAAEAAEQAVKLAIKNKWEDFGAGLIAEAERSEDEPEGLTNEAMVGFRFSLPLPFWNKNEGRIQESRAAAQRARKETEARVVEAQGEAIGARGEMAALASVIADMDDHLLPKARELETQLRQVYAAGQGTLTEVLRTTERRLTLESRRLDALRDYHLARVRYAAAVGKPNSRP
jgi:outer membrane protein, heavy metal efflux system